MIRTEHPDGTVTYQETPEELAEQVLTQIAIRMEQLLNEIMLVCPPHRVKYWEREQEEIKQVTRNWLMARTGAISSQAMEGDKEPIRE